MNYTQDLADILNTVVTGMSFPVTIGSVTVNADGSITLRCDDIYHAQEGFDVTINSTTYRIVSFDQATETITVTGTGAITPGDTFEMYKPHFFHGVPIATDQELRDLDNTAVDNAQNKTPMIWLWENFTEKVIDDLSPLGRDIDGELFFLTQGNFADWKTADAYRLAIKPMRRLLDRFIEAVKAARAIFDADELPYSTRNYSKFGIIIRTKGSEKKLFADNLSGLEVPINFKLWAVESCPAAFEIDPVPGAGIGSAPIGSTPIL